MKFLAVFLLAAAPLFAQTSAFCSQSPRPAYAKLERVLPTEPWFHVYKIRPGVFAIYELRQFEEVISYLIVGQRKAVLFDTGMGMGDIKALAAKLTELPVSVLNSHTHNDHVGDNWRFADIYGTDTAFTRADAKGSVADAQAELAPGSVCGKLPAGFIAKTYRTRHWHISHWLHDGETLDLGGRTLQVLSVPGHTPDSIALLDKANGLLFTGDMYYPGPIWLFRPETDLNAYVASMRRLAALAPQLKLLLPAHNEPVADPAVLPEVVAAMEQVRRGEVKSVENDGKKEYKFDGFSFLMAK